MKRPLLWTAAAVCIFCAVLVCAFPGLAEPKEEYRDGQSLNIKLQIEQVEVKEKNIYVYARKDGKGREVLLTAFRSDFSPGEFAIGKTLQVKCRFRSFEHARNKGNFDEKKYYNSLGIFEKFELVRIVGSSGRISYLKQTLNDISTLLGAFIRETGAKAGEAEERAAGALSAMVTGNRAGLDSSLSDLYRITGIFHILAVSGLHISFIGTGLFSFLRRRTGILPASGISLAAVILFCIMNGSGISSVRAVIMFAVRTGAVCLGKKYDMACSMSLAAILLLLKEPFYITNNAFLLSFAAVFAVSVAVPAVRTFTKGLFDKKKRILKVIDPLITSTVIMLFTLPAVINTYYGFPVYGSFLNLAVIPIAGWIFGFGLSGSLIGLVIPAVGSFILAPAIYILTAIEWICRKAASLSGSYLICGNMESIKVVIYYAMLLGFLMVLTVINLRMKREKQGRKLLRVTILAGVILIFLEGLLIFYNPERNNLEVFCLDVDQGQCLVMRTPDSHVYMFDAGSSTVNEVCRYRISGSLKYEGISYIDACFISHPDTDHISGALQMLEAEEIGIGKVFTPVVSGNENYEALKTLCAKEGTGLVNLSAGLSAEGGGLSVQCIYPEADFSSGEVNDYSAVLIVRWSDFTALITGDLGSEKEKKLAGEIRDAGDFSLYIAGHHGSRYSSCEELLEAARPKVVFISAGVDNSYGHPHIETLERLSQAGAAVFATNEYGEIILKVTPGGDMTVFPLLQSNSG